MLALSDAEKEYFKQPLPEYTNYDFIGFDREFDENFNLIERDKTS